MTFNFSERELWILTFGFAVGAYLLSVCVLVMYNRAIRRQQRFIMDVLDKMANGPEERE